MAKQKINNQGLKRSIDSPIRRMIRQNCGFGCIKCGCAIYEYEHVEPEFKDAYIHDPDCIVLLCGSCHNLVTKGLLSKETIKALAKNPKCKQTGFSFGPFDIGNEPPEILMGTYKCKNVRTLISIEGEPIFTVNPPIFNGGPFSLNALMTDLEGNEILRIEQNEWKSNSESWDIEIVGRTITIRKKLGDIILMIRADPPNKLTVVRLKMEYKGVQIFCKEGGNISITNPNGTVLETNGMSVTNYDIGLNIRPNGFDLPSGGGKGSFVSMDHFRIGK